VFREAHPERLNARTPERLNYGSLTTEAARFSSANRSGNAPERETAQSYRPNRLWGDDLMT
jgi:hypothetical protein